MNYCHTRGERREYLVQDGIESIWTVQDDHKHGGNAGKQLGKHLHKATTPKLHKMLLFQWNPLQGKRVSFVTQLINRPYRTSGLCYAELTHQIF
jgi:hypothetical protein